MTLSAYAHFHCRNIFGAPIRHRASDRGYQAMVPETLVPRLDAAGGGRGSATTQATDGIPDAANEVRRIIAEIATRTHALCESNVWCRRKFGECRKFAASVRAIDGICEILKNNTGAHEPHPHHLLDPAFPQQARQLLETLNDNVDFQNPLPKLERTGYRLRIARARRLYNYLNSGDNRDAVSRFLDDDDVTDRWKRAVMRCLSRAVTVALAELEMSPLQEQAAVFAYRSLQSGQTLASRIKDVLGVGGGGSQLVVSLTSVYTRRAIVRYANDAGRCGRDAERMLRWITEFHGFNSQEHRVIREDLRSGESARVTGARDRVVDRAGVGTAGLAVFGVIQGLFALSQPMPDDASPDEWMQRGGNLLTGGTDLIYLIGASGRAMPISRLGFQRSMRALCAFAEEAGQGLSVLGGVLTIFHGVFELVGGVRRGDGLTISIGIGHILAGGLMVAAVMFEVPGLQPVAIAFALGTGVLELIRASRDGNVPFNAQVFNKLVEELESQPQHVQRAGVRGELDELKRLAGRWNDWTMDPYLRYLRGVSSGGLEGDRSVARYCRRRLRSLGLGDLVDQMFPMPG